MNGKSEIRKRMSALRNAMPSEEIEKKSRSIQERVTELEAVRYATVVLKPKDPAR